MENKPNFFEPDLLPFLSKLNIYIGRIIYKIEHKMELYSEEEDLMKELYICYRENSLQSLNNYNVNKKTQNGKSKIKFKSGSLNY